MEIVKWGLPSFAEISKDPNLLIKLCDKDASLPSVEEELQHMSHLLKHLKFRDLSKDITDRPDKYLEAANARRLELALNYVNNHAQQCGNQNAFGTICSIGIIGDPNIGKSSLSHDLWLLSLGCNLISVTNLDVFSRRRDPLLPRLPLYSRNPLIRLISPEQSRLFEFLYAQNQMLHHEGLPVADLPGLERKKQEALYYSYLNGLDEVIVMGRTMGDIGRWSWWFRQRGIKTLMRVKVQFPYDHHDNTPDPEYFPDFVTVPRLQGDVNIIDPGILSIANRLHRRAYYGLMENRII